MPNLYKLTQELHNVVQEKAEKHGLNVKIENIYWWNNLCPAIQASQIRQILLAFKDSLGENPESEACGQLYARDYTHFLNRIKNNKGMEIQDYTIEGRIGYVEHLYGLIPKYQAEALCNLWLDGLDPLFDREPETVLSELLEVLQDL